MSRSLCISACVWMCVGWMVGGCSVISPPPLLMQMDGPAPGAKGDVRVMVVLGLAGGVFVDSGAGLEVRAETQLNEATAVGFGLGGGWNLEHKGPQPGDSPNANNNHPLLLWNLRGWGKWNPGDLEWLALTGGAGFAGTDEGLLAFTLDGASTFGYRFAFGDVGSDSGELGVSPYIGPSLGMSLPLLSGSPVLEQSVSPGLGPDMPTQVSAREVYPSLTWFVGFHAGAALDSMPTPSLVTAIELLYLAAFSQTDGASLFSINLGQGAQWHP